MDILEIMTLKIKLYCDLFFNAENESLHFNND